MGNAQVVKCLYLYMLWWKYSEVFGHSEVFRRNNFPYSSISPSTTIWVSLVLHQPFIWYQSKKTKWACWLQGITSGTSHLCQGPLPSTSDTTSVFSPILIWIGGSIAAMYPVRELRLMQMLVMVPIMTDTPRAVHSAHVCNPQIVLNLTPPNLISRQLNRRHLCSQTKMLCWNNSALQTTKKNLILFLAKENLNSPTFGIQTSLHVGIQSRDLCWKNIHNVPNWKGFFPVVTETTGKKSL